ncbi:uncharacterized protein UTRI_02785_B [Ustilago trichophora]|uniref:Uncharacterized protein n=1 Tax=Ustilago trichophora TaxID=86804 RepID=A0A5C3E315_9BASI|nr:uncharacterized protein UTRI_02785_B [Ustilago trichophora]
MSRPATLGIPAAAIWLLFCLLTAISRASIFEGYEWPAEAEQLLTAGLRVPLGQTYSEAQADEFLANAMLHHVREALARSRQPYVRYQTNSLDTLITTATLRPKHTVSTDGIPQETRRRSIKARWFSSPLFVAKAESPMGVEHFQIRLPDQRTVRSLDLIRFDVFKPRSGLGFWLPTAIIRPVYRPGSARLSFRKIYEYPTSVVLYRRMHRISPQAAKESLRRTLWRKHRVWLQKLDDVERDLIYQVWMKALRSDRILESPFFTANDRQLATSAGNKAPESSTPLPDITHPPVVDMDSSGEEDTPPLNAHEFGLPSPHSSENLANIPEASTSGAHAFEQGAPDLVEHDFFNPQRNLASQPIRPQALYPWQERPIGLRSHPPPGFLQQHTSTPILRENDVNLDLSLGTPSSSSGPRGSSESSSARPMSGFSHTKK